MTVEIELAVAASEMECELMEMGLEQLLCAYCWSLWQKPRQFQCSKNLQWKQFPRGS